MKSKRGLVSPFVEIEIVGLDCDTSKYKSVTIGKYVLTVHLIKSYFIVYTMYLQKNNPVIRFVSKIHTKGLG